VHFLRQQLNKEINLNKPDMPAVKRRKLEKQKKIKAELKQELEREKMELLEYARDRSKTASIVDDHFKQMQEEEVEVTRVLYGRMYN
jgi:ribosomal protein S25